MTTMAKNDKTTVKPAKKAVKPVKKAKKPDFVYKGSTYTIEKPD